MLTTILLVAIFLVAAVQTPVTPVRIILLLLAALIGIGAGASEHRGS